MKKVFFSLIMAFAIIASMKAQDVLLVTLQKGDATQIFYGTEAFKEAMAAAENGNTIILGAGTFNATDITKAVSIYGNGYEMRSDTTAQKEGRMAYPTRIDGDFSIALDSIDGQPAKGLYMEGIHNNNQIWVRNHLDAATFAKCRFAHFAVWKDRSIMMTSKDVLFIHCRFASWLEPGDSDNMGINNCIIDILGRNKVQSSILIQNCIIHKMVNSLRGTFKNNIIKHIDLPSSDNSFENFWGSDNNQSLNASCTVYNNVLYPTHSLDNVILKSNNWIVTNTDTFWAEESQSDTAEYNDANTYKLSDQAQKDYIGTDGKQIGLYGSSFPFNTALTIPHIISKDIAPKTENGKLKVSIKVEVGDNTL
ncbi:hypothetical protein [Bacteroides cellulosilyticus]|uniref:hypothetical protein n=1 Tax=Bacteroides cellulosilyticus TaxID=246787 RepID=UPI0032EEBA31